MGRNEADLGEGDAKHIFQTFCKRGIPQKKKKKKGTETLFRKTLNLIAEDI